MQFLLLVVNEPKTGRDSITGCEICHFVFLAMEDIISKLNKISCDAYRKRDFDTVMSLFAPDIRIMHAGVPMIVGKGGTLRI